MKWVVTFGFLGASLYASPSGMEVVHGSSSELQMQRIGEYSIQCTDKTILHWNQFSLESGEKLIFDLPSFQSAVLNRVIGDESSRILGELLSNGRVFVINPNGVLIGPNARIETASFIASSLDVLNEAFLQEQTLKFFGDSREAVVNLGTIHCPSGKIALIGRVVRNEGVLKAEDGKVGLGVGSEVLLSLDEGHTFIKPLNETTNERESKEGTALINEGEIDAFVVELKAAENPYTFAIQQKGLIQARSTQKEAGEVFVHAENGICELDGAINARGEQGEGGRVHLFAERIGMTSTSKIDASGENGGGEVLIGGDYQGKTSQVPNAELTHIAKGAFIAADAIAKGNGGKVIVWGEQETRFFGNISATGGDLYGNGGFVEVSGKDLNFSGFADRSAPNGISGALYLDPINVEISSATTANVSFSAPDYTFTSATPSPATIDHTAIESNLASGNVIIDTSSGSVGSDAGSITVTAGNGISWSSGNDLSLIADGPIVISDTISCSGAGSILLQAKGTGGSSGYVGITINSALSTDSGDITLEGNGSANGSSDQYGVEVASSISSTSGSVIFQNCTGGGNGTSARNHGVFLTTGALVDAPTITATNIQGGNGDNNNDGFRIEAGSLGTANTTTLSITATGGNDPAADFSNMGINLNGGTIEVGDSAGITLNGTGGGVLAGGAFNRGIDFESGAFTTGTNCTISLQGTGGKGSSGAGQHRGVNLNELDTVTYSIGDNSVLTFENSQGGEGGSFNIGVSIGQSLSISGPDAAIHFSNISGGNTGEGNYGVRIRSSAVLEATTFTSSDVVGGEGTTDNYGIYFQSGTFGSSNAANINLSATGGTGASATSDNYGIYFAGGGIEVGDSASVTLSGTGGGNASNNGSDNNGIFLSSGNITVGNDGSISLQGNGGSGSGGNHRGVFSTSAVYTLGTNTDFTVENCQGGSGGGLNRGFSCSSSITTSGTGIITLQNITGGSSDDSNYGMQVFGGTLNAPTINISNVNGGNGVNLNYGILISGNPTIQVGDSGTLTINATGGGDPANAGAQNYGIHIFSGSITSGTGSNVTLNGTGGDGSGGANYGMVIREDNPILTTGTNSTLSFQGTGGSGDGGSNIGVVLWDGATYSIGDNSTLTFENISGGSGGNRNRGLASLASISIGGENGTMAFDNVSGAGSGSQNYGIQLISGTFDATNITGANISGGEGTSSNYGLYLAGATLGSSNTTSMNISAVGGGGDAIATEGNNGIQVESTIQVGSNGTLNLTGTGGKGTTGNIGVNVSGASALIQSADGNLALEGTGGEGTSSYGLSLGSSGEISASGSGNVTINETSGDPIALGSCTLSSVSGSVELAAPVTLIASTPSIATGGTGNITFDDTLDGAFGISLDAGGTLTFLGDVGNSTAPTSFTTLASGFSIGGDITTNNAAITFADPVTLTQSSTFTSGGGNVEVSSTIDGTTSGQENFTIASGGGAITLSGAVGGTTPLGELSLGGGPIELSSDMTTSGAISFLNPVTTTSAVTIANEGSGGIDFASTVTAGGNLSLNAESSAVSIDGLVSANGSSGSSGSDVVINAQEDITLSADMTSLGGAAVGGVGQQGGDITLVSSGGNISVQSLDVSGSDGATSGGDAGTIHLQPATTCQSGVLGCIPDGRIILSGNLTAVGGTGATDGADGSILLAASERSQAPSIASIVSSFSGNNVTLDAGTITIGSREVMTILGNLTMNATTQISSSDVIALNTLSITTPSYTLTSHGNEQVLQSDGSLALIESGHMTAGTLDLTIDTFNGDLTQVTETTLSAAQFSEALQYIPLSYLLNFGVAITPQEESTVQSGAPFVTDLQIANAQFTNVLQRFIKQTLNKNNYLFLEKQQ